MSRLADAYARLPYPAKVAAAAARGAQLSRWRYGSDHAEALVELALEADTISTEAWRQLTLDRTARYLHRAASTVPHHRAHWAKRRATATGAHRRSSPTGRCSPRPRSRPIPGRSSPRTAGRVRCSPSTRAARQRLPLHLVVEPARHPLLVHAVRGPHPPLAWRIAARTVAILGGQPVVASDRRRPPYWVWNPSMNQLYLSSYHLSADTVADYADTLADRSVTHLVGYPSALATLARLLIATGAPPPPRAPRGPHQRGDAARWTAGRHRAGPRDPGPGHVRPGRDRGGGERVRARHPPPVAGGRRGRSARRPRGPARYTGATGRMVATGLLNDTMALIRYDTGDRARASADGQPACTCGRTLPAFGQVEGRRDDVVLTPDGREVGRLDPVFKSDFPIAEARSVRKTSGAALLVRVVAPDGFGPDTREQVARRLATGSATSRPR